jgi:hypothetical protein
MRSKRVCPNVGLDPLTAAYIDGLGFELIEMDNGLGYWRLLRDFWRAREPVLIIEHDVVPWDGAVDELEACSEPWCAGGYNEHDTNLGLVKFTPEHMAQIPDVWDRMELRNWRDCHCHHGITYERAGIAAHRHGPPMLNTGSIRRGREWT